MEIVSPTRYVWRCEQLRSPALVMLREMAFLIRPVAGSMADTEELL